MKNGFAIPAIVIWIAIAAFAILAISKAGSSNNPGQISNLQPSPTPVIVSEADLINQVTEFYADISAQDLSGAWNLLSKNFQGNFSNYASFAAGYKTTSSVTVSEVNVQNIGDKIVYVKLESSDDINGQVLKNTYTGTWKLVQENGILKLDSADMVLEDPIVNCSLKNLDVVSLKKSECDKSFACQIGNTWIRYTSRAQCTTDQQKNTQDQANAPLMKAMDDYNKACNSDAWKQPILPPDCQQAITSFTAAKDLWIISNGGKPTDTTISDQIFSLQQKQKELENQINAQGRCNSNGGRWNGSSCSY